MPSKQQELLEMAPSILGKRARAAETTKDLSSISSRVKRRAVSSVVNDENADPETAPTGCNYHQLGDSISPGRFRKVAINLAKYTPAEERIALSPAKCNSRIKTSESAASECQEPVQLATPKTPRHCDALSKKIPITPRHRVGLIGKSLTPRRTPRTPLTVSSAPTIYNEARQLFLRSAYPGRLIGREQERRELNSFIQCGIHTRSGRCLYVSGPPGTGKSALVAEVCHEIQSDPNVKTTYINCMGVKCSKDILRKLTEDLTGDTHDIYGNELTLLQNTFLPMNNTLPGPTYVVTLDEIDHLLALDLEIMYTLFDWSLDRSSRLILIGIANALDLTDRFLPRLKARNLKPELLPFLPYTATQIAAVITTKLKTISVPERDYLPFFHPAAIQFCAKKVASQTGDLRKAFDIIRRTIDLIECETKHTHPANIDSEELRKAPFHDNPNLSSPCASSSANLATRLSILSPTTAPRATIAHVARVSSAALANGAPQRLQALNLQQKAALCALVYLEKTNLRHGSLFNTPSKIKTSPTIRKLYDTYCALCKRDNALQPLTGTEFADVLGGLETLGLVGNGDMEGKLGKRRLKPEDRRIAGRVSEVEMEGCLEGIAGGILRSLLKEDD